MTIRNPTRLTWEFKPFANPEFMHVVMPLIVERS